MKKPKYISIGLKELKILLKFYKLAIQCPFIGNCSPDRTYEQEYQSIKNNGYLVTSEQLENLIYHFKLCVLEFVRSGSGSLFKNPESFMKQLAKTAPQLFKKTNLGETVLYEFR